MESKETTDINNNYILFYCESNEPLAKSLVSLPSAKFISMGNIMWKTFEDGFPNIMIKDVHSLRGKHCIVLLDFLNLEKIFAQLSVIYALPRYYARSLTLVLSYFPTGTMERIDEEGQIATAMTLARLFSYIPLTSYGPARIIIYDIHALQERFYFGDSVIPILDSAIPIFVEQLKKAHDKENIAIVFPDEGAWKRFHNQFVGYKLIICNKIRDGDKRIVSIGEGQEYCQDSHVFIVDDLVKTGGTLLECKKALRKFGAKFVSAFVTHAVFPRSSWQRFINEPEDIRFKHFYTTNTCPTTVQEIRNFPPFEVLDLAPHLLKLLSGHRHY